MFAPGKLVGFRIHFPFYAIVGKIKTP
uniref:Uncharacterized protein n=1 Tax=Anguilla anguilla TaxID=7936 RepID=A0A0E9Q988_ANGAN